MSLATNQTGGIGLTEKDVSFPFNIGIGFLSFRFRMEGQINQDRPSFSIKRQGIFIISLAEHVFRFDPRHLFYGPVPGYDFSISVNYQCGIRKELDDVR